VLRQIKQPGETNPYFATLYQEAWVGIVAGLRGHFAGSGYIIATAIAC
jgi:hypothetical protein